MSTPASFGPQAVADPRYIAAMTKTVVCLCAVVMGFASSCSRHEVVPEHPAKQGPAAPAPQGGPSETSLAPAPGEGTPSNGDSLATSKGPVQILPIQHAAVMFSFGGKHIYVDPAAEGNYQGLPKADFIFITHGHFDHFDQPRISSLRGTATVVVGPPDVAAQISGAQSMKSGDKSAFASFEVVAVPSYNLVRGPKPGQLFHPKGQGEGFIFTFGDKRIYVSGDTECTPEMKALENIDVAFVCMRLPYTMPPKEAAECIKMFKPRVVYPYHYQTSNLQELTAALATEKSIEVRLRDWYPKK